MSQLLITTVNILSEAEEGSVSAFRVRGNGNGDLQNQMLEFRILVCGLDVHMGDKVSGETGTVIYIEDSWQYAEFSSFADD